MSILEKPISFYKSVGATTSGTEKSLLSILKSDEYRPAIELLRDCSDADRQSNIKLTLPCYTVAGTFSGRSNDGLIKHSGLACVDLDSAEDYDLTNLISELKKIDCIAYAGLSCRGFRLFCIVPFAFPDKYEKQYERLTQSFIEAGLPMGDKCHSKISQPRFVSWSPNELQFFNHVAKPYRLLPVERKVYTIKKSYSGGKNPDNAFDWIIQQINKSHSFIPGNRHPYMVAVARYCNLKGMTEDEALNGCLHFIQDNFTEDEIKSIVHHVYTKQTDSHAKHPFNSGTPQQQPTATKPIKRTDAAPQATVNHLQTETAPVLAASDSEMLHRIFYWMGCQYLSRPELINGIIYENKKGLPIARRLENATESEINKASEIIHMANSSGELIFNKPLYELPHTVESEKQNNSETQF